MYNKAIDLSKAFVHHFKCCKIIASHIIYHSRITITHTKINQLIYIRKLNQKKNLVLFFLALLLCIKTIEDAADATEPVWQYDTRIEWVGESWIGKSSKMKNAKERHS